MNWIMNLRVTDYVFTAVERLTGRGLVIDDGRLRWGRLTIPKKRPCYGIVALLDYQIVEVQNENQ